MELPPVPVVAGTVQEKDVPIYLEGLGTVQAFNAVSIRARVDGQLKKVAFVEGQEVKAGDLLALIDPDPYQAQLEQAAARKGQDEAQLANAHADLKRYADLLATEGVTQQVYDTQKALVNQLESQFSGKPVSPLHFTFHQAATLAWQPPLCPGALSTATKKCSG